MRHLPIAQIPQGFSLFCHPEGPKPCFFARKNVHLGYMSPPGQTLRALNHSFFQKKRRLRSSDGHKTMHFLWETHTLVTRGPKGLTSRALNHSFLHSNRIHCVHGVPHRGLPGPGHAKIIRCLSFIIASRASTMQLFHIGSRLPLRISDSLIVLSPNLPCTLFVIAFYPEASTLIPSTVHLLCLLHSHSYRHLHHPI